MVDVQPHYFGGLIDRVDLVIDHHPEQPGYTAVFKDIRADYGSTCTILTEHLRAVDVNISERTATAMLYAIKSDTLFFNRQTNRVDLEAFSYLYPLADAALIRKMEGAEITLERLDYVLKAHQGGTLRRAGVLRVPRHDAARGLHPLRRRLLPAARGRQVDGHRRARQRLADRSRCGTSATRRTPGEFVRRFFADIGSAGGHRAMAKAVVPMRAFREKFGALEATAVGAAPAGTRRRSSCTKQRPRRRRSGRPSSRREAVLQLHSTFDVLSTQPFAARADHRLDELVVGVLVARDPSAPSSGCTPIRSVVEPAGEIERADRVVRRANREQLASAGCARHETRRIADRRRFRRLQVLAEPARAVEPRPRPARAGPASSGAADTRIDLLDAQLDQFLEHTRQAAGPDRTARCVSPRQ